MSNLYNKILLNISEGILKSLNEMSKNISFRNIDRNLWLSVSSMCSRNKDTEAEFVKPYGSRKNDLIDQMQRYVAALLIMKKPCPKTEQDIDKIKTYKLIGHHAIELGATIEDIQSCYDINSGKSTSTEKPVEKVNKPVVEPKKVEVAPAPAKAKRGKIQLKYMDKLNAMIANVSPSIYQRVPTINNGVYGTYIDNNPVYLACKTDIENYVKTAVKKSHQNVEEFIKYIQTDFSNFYKVIPHDRPEYLEISYSIGSEDTRYDRYYMTFNFQIMSDDYKMFIHYREASSSSNRREYDIRRIDNDLLKGDLTKYVPSYSKDEHREGNVWSKKSVNVLEKFIEYIFIYIVVPFVNIKVDEQIKANKNNSTTILNKYHMSNTTSNYFNWMRENIKTILKNNPDFEIEINYSDHSGAIDSFYYNSKNNAYWIKVWMTSGNSDTNSYDNIDNLLNASMRNGYQKRYVNEVLMREFKAGCIADSDDAIFDCTIWYLDDLAEKVFNIVKKYIEKGWLN